MPRGFFLVSLGLLAIVAGCITAPAGIVPTTGAANPVATGIAGTVSDRHGVPAAGANIYAYRNPRGGLRGPADFEAVVDTDGRYLLDLVEGSYYLVARQRSDGGDAGPPRTGDAWALPEKNPVVVVPGRLSVVNFILHSVAQPMLMRDGTLTSGDTGFTGVLIDADGTPVIGAFVIAYPDTDVRHMPEATSPAVGDDGRFTLYVERPGRWCLAARTRTRGQPVAGELYGVLGEGTAGCREAAAGALSEVGAIRLSPYRR